MRAIIAIEFAMALEYPAADDNLKDNFVESGFVTVVIEDFISPTILKRLENVDEDVLDGLFREMMGVVWSTASPE